MSDGFYIFRFTLDATIVGDTWHMTVEDAKDQAAFEYGDALGEWREIPSEAEDAAAFALHEIRGEP